MKLKTLKDVENQDWSTHEEDMELVRAVFFELKAEAVKWVKDMRFKLKENPNLDKMEWFPIHFFNIIEEDLE